MFAKKYSELELHNFRVGFMASKLAKMLKLKPVKQIEIAGLNHDIGKLYLPETILNKPSILTYGERQVIQKHPLYSCAILKKKGYSPEICDFVKFHHENFDGTGYPFGLKGVEIPIGSRVIKVCDVFDALTSNRVYRSSLSVADAFKVMDKEHSTFDPDIYDLFIANYKNII